MYHLNGIYKTRVAARSQRVLQLDLTLTSPSVEIKISLFAAVCSCRWLVVPLTLGHRGSSFPGQRRS